MTRSISRTPRSRYYERHLYQLFVEPRLTKLHDFVTTQIEQGERVIDVGCGTGSLVSRLATRAAAVVGVELSPVMISLARARPGASRGQPISFVLGDVTDALRELPAGSFDTATLVLVLHEMPARTRVPALREISRLARRVLCLDFHTPMPWNLSGGWSRVLEVMAGVEHYLAYRDFSHRGGVRGIADEAGLRCRHLRDFGDATLSCFILTPA